MDVELVKITLDITKPEARMLAELLKVAGEAKEVLWPEQRFNLSSNHCDFIKNQTVRILQEVGK